MKVLFKPRGRAISLMMAVIVLPSCSSLTAPSSHIEDIQSIAPSSWSENGYSKNGVEHNWVARFGDKRLQRLVDESVIKNPDLVQASERVKQSFRAVDLAGVSAQPQVSATVGSDRDRTVFVGLPFGGSNTTTTNRTSFDVSWEPDIWGRVRATQQAAIADYSATYYSHKAARASLAARICKAWFALAEVNGQIKLVEESLKLRRETEEAIKDRFENNLDGQGGSASQLRLAQTEIATTKALLSQRKGEAAIAKRQLELLGGNYPAGKLSGSATLPRIKSSPPVGMPSDLLLRRPDILMAERNYTASIVRIKEAKLAVFPVFNLTGSVGTRTDMLRNILNSNFGVWSLGGSIAQSIYTGGRVKHEVSRRESIVRENLAALQSTTLTAFGEVENALATEHWLAKRITEMRSAERLSKEAAAAAKEDYILGTGDLLTVLSTQNSRIEISSQILTLRRLRLDNRVDLHLALGGDFSTSSKQSK